METLHWRRKWPLFQFFKTREADIFYEGYVRQVPKPDTWSVVRGPWDGMLYQEGGFWATPNHHVLPFLAQYDIGMACRILNDTIASFRGRGIWEWIGPFFPGKTHGAPGYTASAANTYFASEHLRCWEATSSANNYA